MPTPSKPSKPSNQQETPDLLAAVCAVAADTKAGQGNTTTKPDQARPVSKPDQTPPRPKQERKPAKETARARKTRDGGSKTKTPRAAKMPFFDPATREGRRGRLEWMVNHGIDTQARAAIKDLEEMAAEDAGNDPNAKVDPADVCAFLTRAHLHGLDPAKVLLQSHGLKRVIHAIGARLGLAHLSGSLGGTVADYKDDSQCLQGVASDQVSSAMSSEVAP